MSKSKILEVVIIFRELTRVLSNPNMHLLQEKREPRSLYTTNQVHKTGDG